MPFQIRRQLDTAESRIRPRQAEDFSSSPSALKAALGLDSEVEDCDIKGMNRWKNGVDLEISREV